jgi:periplasmic divalent cation tolerance protein
MMAGDRTVDTSLVRVVFVTVPDAETGLELARRVVEEKLAACGNVIPGVRSVYRWAGEVQEDSEALVVFKTTESALTGLEERVVELHGYDVPEFLALPVTHGHDPYLRWVSGAVDGPDYP